MRATWLVLLAGCDLVFELPSPPPPISFIQQNSMTGASSITSVPFIGPQGAGDLNVVVVGWYFASLDVVSVSDTAGNDYRVAAAEVGVQSSVFQTIYYASSIAAADAGENTVTVTMSPSGAPPVVDVRILEYAGLSAEPLDIGTGMAGSGDDLSSGSLTTRADHELLVAAATMGDRNVGIVVSEDYEVRVQSDRMNVAADRVVSAIGTHSAEATRADPTGEDWVLQLVAFKQE